MQRAGRERTAVIVAAVVALLAAAAVLAVVLLSGGSDYRMTVKLQNASQLVTGNEVKVAGEAIGTVQEIRLTDDNQAEIDITITAEGFSPLREGTRAAVRVASLSGVANRYIDLQLGGADQDEIPSGGTLQTASTESAVDLDQLFNVFDPVARTAVSKSIRLFGDFNDGREEEAQEALRYLNPVMSSSARLFRELDRNTEDTQRFIDETARLVTDVSDNDDALAGLIDNLATTTNALALERDDLGEAIGRLPTFLRRANTTFVNLRASLDDLDPLVTESEPIVRDSLRQLFAQLRPFARDAEPTFRDLSRTIRRPGADNDLVELLRRQPAIDQIANRTAERNGARRVGAFPAMRQAATDAAPQLGFLRPYSTELVGWFDNFSSTGMYDALGGFSRAGLQFNQFTLTPTAELLPVPPELRQTLGAATVAVGRDNRCPGSNERTAPDGSNPYIPPNVRGNCDETIRPVGP